MQKIVGDFQNVTFHLLRMSWRKFFFALFCSYICINFVFALIYFSMGPEGLSGISAQSGLDYFIACYFFSVQTFSTIGYGQVAPIGFLQNCVVSLQALVGMMSIGLMSGLFFSRFTKANAQVVFSDVMLIHRFHGQSVLTFRLANSRKGQILDASLQLTYMADFQTSEGQHIYKLVDLALVRRQTPAFALSWTVIHVIDESSPLFGLSREEMKKKRAQFFVLMSGHDETFAQQVHARQVFSPEQIVYDRYFVDIISGETRETRAVDISKISTLKSE